MTLIKSGTINVAITATMMLLDTTLSSIISLWTILSLFCRSYVPMYHWIDFLQVSLQYEQR